MIPADAPGGHSCPDCADHSACGRFLREGFAELGWDVTVSTAPPLVVNAFTTAPFVCPHGVSHWAEPTGEQLAEGCRSGELR